MPRKPKMPKAYQPWKPPKPFDPFKPAKKVKEEALPHTITYYEQTLIDSLRPVIQRKQLIRFWYKDENSDFADWRTVEPHLIGQTKYKAANILLSGWFLPTAEQLLNGHEAKWGNYILDNVKDVEILSRVFMMARPGYNPNDSRMTTIFCATR
jgi:hypothetical protein